MDAKAEDPKDPPDLPPPAPPRAPAAVPDAPGGPWRVLWQLAQPLLAIGVLLLLAATGISAAVVWLLREPAGTAWLLERVPGLEIQGQRGALLSSDFGFDRLLLRWDRGQQSLAIDRLQAQGLRWHWNPVRGAWLGLDAERLTAARVTLQTGPAGPRPIQMPRTIGLPIVATIASVGVGELQIDELPLMQRVGAARVRLWHPREGYHAERLVFDWERAHVEGRATLGAAPPFELQASARAASRGDGPRWQADAKAGGPLARLTVDGTLRGELAAASIAEPARTARAPASARPATAAAAPPATGAAALPAALDVQATVTPLEAWPLGALRLSTRALDLSALAERWPRTALSGRVDIDSRARRGPIAAAIELDNARPGRWDDRQLPLARLSARIESPEADRDGVRQRLTIQDFDLRFARGSEGAGRWRGRGAWNRERLELDTRFDELRPHLIDPRTAVMTVSGPAELVLDGLPLPGTGTGTAAARKPLALELKTQLEGRIDGSPSAVTLQLDGRATEQQIDVRELRAEAGAARLQLSGLAQRAAGAKGGTGGTPSWQIESRGSLSDFDPLPWWPGSEGALWRQGPHRLSGNWTLDLAVPVAALKLPLLGLAQNLSGSGKIQVDRSLVAGVPLALQLDLRQQPGDTSTPSRVQGELNLGGTRLVVNGQGNPLGEGRADRLRIDWQSESLAPLAPLLRLVPDLAAWAPRSGQTDGGLTIEGRWPDIRSQGQAKLGALQLGTALTLRQADLRWQLDAATTQPLMLLAEGQGLAYGSQRADSFRAELRGTLRQHRLEASATLPLRPPAAAETGLGLRVGSGTRAELSAEGEWSGESAGGGGAGGTWSGRVERLWVGAAGAPVAAGVAPLPGSTWLEARDLRASATLSADAGLSSVQAAAGQLRLAEALTLRWDSVSIDLRGPRAAFAVRADIEPFALAPLLARAQPTMGWGGDLRLTARVDLRVADTVNGELVFERRDGDLRLADELNTPPFGLSEFRVRARAAESQWQLDGRFVGRTLGDAGAQLALRTRAGERWPDVNTPIEGRIDAQVANLGIWGTWVPPGWRLSGALDSSVSVGGRLGQPTYAGVVQARDVAVRNLLLGVDLREGQARIDLRGTRAEIERMSLQGGDGRIDIAGGADLAAKPSAKLRLVAERFRVLGRVDRQLVASGTLDLNLGEDLIEATGKLKIDQGFFDLSRSDAPSLDDDVSLRSARPRAEEEETAPAPPRNRRAPRVAIDLDLGEKIEVRGRGLQTTLGGELKIGASGGPGGGPGGGPSGWRPTVRGIVSASGGTYAAYGQKLDIERGILLFSGDAASPSLDVLALRPNLDIQVGVAITGTPQIPRVRLYSSGDMSDQDKLSWLLLGRASDGLARADTALLQRAAVALLAGEGEAPTDTLLRNLGLDSFSLRQSDTDVRETVVSLGKQLSRRWYVGYERGVNATAGTWQLIYRIAQRFTLRAQSGLENSLDLIWVWRLEDKPPVPVATPAPAPLPAPPPARAPR